MYNGSSDDSDYQREKEYVDWIERDENIKFIDAMKETSKSSYSWNGAPLPDYYGGVTEICVE